MRVYVEINGTEFEGVVADDADLDGTFALEDEQDFTRWNINGWLADHIEIVD